ncbi:ArsC/Spx/MgsR family protein [Paracoccus sp. N5]|uniref:arsenate reductase family protein n=1 Tax=Paracoccus sp. N5 TaxID=1101189 RepID=UPI0009D9DC56|nr:ArsC/Spx/MgsR family protein [Paracoccus sp. N5]
MYGLAHCSTCQKAQAELEAEGWQVAFRDVAKTPLDEAEWQRMIADFGEKLVNRASLTWRGMSEAERAGTPLRMLSAKPSLMKRPAIVAGDLHLLGWTANVKRALGVAA